MKRKRYFRTYLTLVLCIAALLLSVSGCEAADTERSLDIAPLSPIPTLKPMLLEFTKDHCLPCEIMAPWVAKLRETYKGKVDILEINLDLKKNKELGTFFNVRNIPTQVYINKRGIRLDTHIGLATLNEMDKTLKKLKLLDR